MLPIAAAITFVALMSLIVILASMLSDFLVGRE
jgi:hypothetical protein